MGRETNRAIEALGQNFQRGMTTLGNQEVARAKNSLLEGKMKYDILKDERAYNDPTARLARADAERTEARYNETYDPGISFSQIPSGQAGVEAGIPEGTKENLTSNFILEKDNLGAVFGAKYVPGTGYVFEDGTPMKRIDLDRFMQPIELSMDQYVRSLDKDDDKLEALETYRVWLQGGEGKQVQLAKNGVEQDIATLKGNSVKAADRMHDLNKITAKGEQDRLTEGVKADKGAPAAVKTMKYLVDEGIATDAVDAHRIYTQAKNKGRDAWVADLVGKWAGADENLDMQAATYRANEAADMLFPKGKPAGNTDGDGTASGPKAEYLSLIRSGMSKDEARRKVTAKYGNQ